MKQLGDAGRHLIQSFEKCSLRAYQDEAGVWTIGWGHTGPGIHDGLVWTLDQANTQFVADTHNAVLGVAESLTLPDSAIGQNQFDALVSFAFNVGVGSEEHSTLVKYVNDRNTQAAADEFPKWIHSGGHVSNGLIARRAAERALFLSDPPLAPVQTTTAAAEPSAPDASEPPPESLQ